MRVDFNSQQAFGVNVDPKFVNAMRGFMNSGENRLKNNYKLSKKIEEYANFGFDDYTMQLNQKYTAWGTEYTIKAVRDGENSENAAVIAKRTSFRKIVEKFLKINRGELKAKIYRG